MKRGLLVIVLGITFLILITWLGTFITTFVVHRTTAQTQTSRVGPYQITLRVDPNPPSITQATTLTIRVLLNTSQQPVSNAHVTLANNMETMDMGSESAEASARGNGTYVASFQFSMSGPWQVQVVVSTPEAAELNAIFEVMTQ